jgi:hypothetical protein
MSESGIETRTCGHHTCACHRTNPCLDELGVSGEISNLQRSFTNNQGAIHELSEPHIEDANQVTAPNGW